jgi:hypothetical protein
LRKVSSIDGARLAGRASLKEPDLVNLILRLADRGGQVANTFVCVAWGGISIGDASQNTEGDDGNFVHFK